MSNITLNIVEPGSGPTSAPVVPNTGLFTSGIGGPEATAIGAVLILTIATIVVAFLYRKQKESGKVTKLVHLVDSTKAVLKSKKRITAGLSAIALLASAGTLTTLLASANKNNTNAAEEDGLTLDVSSEDLTIEVGSEPVFAILPVDVTVEEATQAGYALTAYTDNTDLVSTTDSSKVIPMVTLPEVGGELSALTNNTYGLALEEPTTKDAEVYMPLSIDSDTPTVLKTTDYTETEANDTTTIYYGFYITPDVPYGTYTGSDVNYEAKENVATVTFDGNGKFYFDSESSQTTNVAKYIPGAQSETEYSHTPNVNDEGVQDGMYPLDSNETFVYDFPGYEKTYLKIIKTEGDFPWPNDDYFSIWYGSHPEYTALNDYGNEYSVKDLTTKYGQDGRYYFYSEYYNGRSVDIADSSITIAYTTDNDRGCCGGTGYGYYAEIYGYNPNALISGDYEKPTTDGAYRFLGWSEDKDATTPTYTSQEDIMRSLDLAKGDVTLYAISEPAFFISYNGNGADTTSNMDNVEQYTTDLESAEKQVDLLASNFTREGYGFAGWSTDQNVASKINNTGDDKPTIYGPNQMITVDPSASTKLNLYAVWVPAETNVTMQTFNPNSEPYASKPNGTVIALKDERDEEVYAVAKLADGNYWMIENLRLDNEPELSTTNTHNPDLPLTNNYSEGTTSNFLSATSNDWCTNYSAECYDQSNLNTNNVANTTASPTFSQDFTSSSHNGNFDNNMASYGNYYNWYSATAGNGKQETGSGVTVAGDICPAGWILPIGDKTDAKGSFSHLDTSMGGTGEWQGSTEASNRWRSFPNNFVYSGYWSGSSANDRGYYGYYWSSTAYANDTAHRLGFSSGDVYPGVYLNNKDSGHSVRCVAQ